MTTRRIGGALGIAVLYLLLTSNLQVSNLVAAAVVGAGLSLLLPSGRPIAAGSLPRAVVAGLQHAVALSWDVLLNGVVVAKMVAGGRSAIRPGFVRMRDRHDRALASALEAHAITISPGTMVIDFEGEERWNRDEADGGLSEDPVGEPEPVFEVHCLDTRMAEDLAGSSDGATTRARVVARIAGFKGRLARDGVGAGNGGPSDG